MKARARRPWPLLACVLALATALVMLGLAESIDLAPPTGSVDPALAATASDFYAAANRVLRDGDDAPLLALVAPDAVEHPGRLGPGGDRDRLIASLRDLRALAPEARIVVESAAATAERGRVAVRLRLDGTAGGTFLGMPLPTGLAFGWGPLESLRIADGVVVERWTGQSTAPVLRPVARLTLPETDATTPRIVGLVRLTLPPSAAVSVVNEFNARAFVVESGTVRVATRRPEWQTRAPARTGLPVALPTPEETPGPVILGAGQALVTGPGENRTLTGAGEGPASILVVTRYGAASLADAAQTDTRALAATGEGAAAADLLATGTAPAGSEKRTLAIGVVDLPPATALLWPPAGGLVLLGHDAGGQMGGRLMTRVAPDAGEVWSNPAATPAAAVVVTLDADSDDDAEETPPG